MKKLSEIIAQDESNKILKEDNDRNIATIEIIANEMEKNDIFFKWAYEAQQILEVNYDIQDPNMMEMLLNECANRLKEQIKKVGNNDNSEEGDLAE